MPFVPKDIRYALDVGCGAGGFGQLLREQTGCKVWGIEPNTKIAEIAKKKN